MFEEKYFKIFQRPLTMNEEQIFYNTTWSILYKKYHEKKKIYFEQFI